MSNANRYRNSIFRYIAGGSSRGVRMVRDLRRTRRKDGVKGRRKFVEWVRGRLPKGDSPENHIHPRHKRKGNVGG